MSLGVEAQSSSQILVQKLAFLNPFFEGDLYVLSVCEHICDYLNETRRPVYQT